MTEGLCRAIGLDPDGAQFYLYGSRLYGTASDKSDYDYIAIVPDEFKDYNGTEHCHGEASVHVYTKSAFGVMLAEHHIQALEVYSQARGNFEFTLNLAVLRQSVAAKASHSFVKAAKKIDVAGELYTGQKSLFHSLRILCFGTQVASAGAIVDFRGANGYWPEILAVGDKPWAEYKSKYQSVYNSLATEFRKRAPK